MRLTDKDEFAIKDGGYAIFENVITDSIVGAGVSVQVKNAAGGTLSLRKESKKGDVVSKCEMPSVGDAGKWVDVRCSNMPEMKGVQDFYLTAEGLGGETLVGNIKFDEGVKDTTDALWHIYGRDAGRNIRAWDGRERNGYRDLKGRRYEKLIRYRVVF